MIYQQPKRRGLAAVSRERRQAIARLGARASVASRRAHRWTREEARLAAQQGVAVRRARRAAVQALITRFLPPVLVHSEELSTLPPCLPVSEETTPHELD